MYIKYFKMDQEPFSVRPKTEFFFASPAHQQTLELLKTSIEYGEPLILVHGEYGAGKTLVCLKLLEHLEDNVSYIYFSSSDVTWREVLRKMLVHLGISDIDALDESELKSKIFDFYSDNPQTPPVYLLFDDFQETDESVIYHLRKIINFNVNGIFPIRLILVAHTSFLEKIQDDPTLEPFLQRLRRRIQLRPLSDEEMREYIYFRLFNAGARGRPIFSDEALNLIKRESSCIPRLINNICDAVLIVAARNNMEKIDAKLVKTALELYSVSGNTKHLEDLSVKTFDEIAPEQASYEKAFNFSETYRHGTSSEPARRSDYTPSSREADKKGASGNRYNVLTIILAILLTASVTYIVMNNRHNSPAMAPVTMRSPARPGPIHSPNAGKDATQAKAAIKTTKELSANTREPAVTNNYSYQYKTPAPAPTTAVSNNKPVTNTEPENTSDRELAIKDPLVDEAMIPFTVQEDGNGT